MLLWICLNSTNLDASRLNHLAELEVGHVALGPAVVHVHLEVVPRVHDKAARLEQLPVGSCHPTPGSYVRGREAQAQLDRRLRTLGVLRQTGEEVAGNHLAKPRLVTLQCKTDQN